MKILLFGKNGQLGQALTNRFSSPHALIALGREEVDLAQITPLNNILSHYQPDLIINAAAYTAVDKAEQHIETAHRINADAVGIMADYAFEHGSKLIHFSTDYVFDGEQNTPYLETRF